MPRERSGLYFQPETPAPPRRHVDQGVSSGSPFRQGRLLTNNGDWRSSGTQPSDAHMAPASDDWRSISWSQRASDSFDNSYRGWDPIAPQPASSAINHSVAREGAAYESGFPSPSIAFASIDGVALGYEHYKSQYGFPEATHAATSSHSAFPFGHYGSSDLFVPGRNGPDTEDLTTPNTSRSQYAHTPYPLCNWPAAASPVLDDVAGQASQPISQGDDQYPLQTLTSDSTWPTKQNYANTGWPSAVPDEPSYPHWQYGGNLPR